MLLRKYSMFLWFAATAAVVLGVFRVQWWGWMCLCVLALALIGVSKDQKKITWEQFAPAGFITILIFFLIYKYAGPMWDKVIGYQLHQVRHVFNWNATFNSIPFNDGHFMRYWQPKWLTKYFSWVYMNGFTLSYWICVIRAYFTKDIKKLARYSLAGYLLQVPLILPFYNTILLQEVWFVQGTPDILQRHLEGMKAYTTAWNCFPSMHTSIAFAAILLAQREKSKWFRWVITTYCTSIIVATLYLKVHWVLDVMAGMLFAFLCVKLADLIVKAKFFENFAARFENISAKWRNQTPLQMPATKRMETFDK
ncbi:MAG: phosphatase PAP2 family protein [Tumebacillaceae bacterium]